MTEQNNEGQHFYVAGRYGSEKKVEVKTPHRNFVDIQKDLRGLINSPDSQREKELTSERARLLREAKDTGIFGGIKRDLASIQEEYDFPEAHRRIASYDISRIENQLEDTLEGWRPEFAGILPEYRDAALRHMELAFERARGLRRSQHAKDLEREIELRGWGTPPTFLEAKAKEYLDSQQQPTQQTGGTDRAADVLERQEKEAMGHEKRTGGRVRELKEAGNPPEGWARLVFEELAVAEKLAAEKQKRSEEHKRVWNTLEDAIEEMPEGVGQVDTTSDLARYMVHRNPDGLYLKDRLKFLISARKDFTDRFVEVDRANGSLVAMGKGKDDVPFEGITYKLQRLLPENWWVMYHGDEMFADVQGHFNNTEIKEFLPDVGKASEIWMDVGRQYVTLPDGLLKLEERAVLDKIFAYEAQFNNYYQNPQNGKDKDKERKRTLGRESYWPDIGAVRKFMVKPNEPSYLSNQEFDIYKNIPTYEKSLNMPGVRNEIQRRIRNLVGSENAEALADRVFRVTLTYAMLDRGRASQQGSDEDRELMWSERKKVSNFGDKTRDFDNEFTIGAYFVQSPDQAFSIKEEDASKDVFLARRRAKLQYNAGKGALSEEEGYYQGEILSDFFHTTIVVPDELMPGETIDRKLSSYFISRDGSIINGGFKKIPFLLSLGEKNYSGYFGYNIGKAEAISNMLEKLAWEKPEEMFSEKWWRGRWTLLDHLKNVSPRFNSRRFDFRGLEIRQKLTQAGGFNPQEVAKISGYSSEADLDVITNPVQRQAAINIVTASASDIVEKGKDNGDKFWEVQFRKFRMLDALGQVWNGSLDAKVVAGLTDKSIISPDNMKETGKALIGSRYLVGDTYRMFVRKADRRLQFGVRWLSRR